MSKYGQAGNSGEHMHPIAIVFYLWRVFYFILIPILRGFFLALRGDFASWATGAWIDILVLVFMLSLAALRWYFTTYSWNHRCIAFHSGFLSFRHTAVEWEKIATLSVIDSFYLRPFKAVYLRADTLGGSYKNSDVALYLGRERARAILKHYNGPSDISSRRRYEPAISSVLALALLSSNSFAGVVYISAFISQSGKLLGAEFSDMLIGAFEETTRALAFGIIPPAAAAIGYMLLAGWFIGFVLTLIRYKSFCVTGGSSVLNIRGGIFTSRDYSINCSHINFVDIRQTITTKILKLYSLYIYAPGYGKHKDDMSCIILAERKDRFNHARQLFFPDFTPSARILRPARRSIFRYISEPLAFCAAIPVAMFICSRLFSNWSSFILFVGLMSMVPSILFLTVRIVDFVTGGIGWDGDKYTMHYSKWFNIHTVVFPKDKIVKVTLRQSFFQRFGPYCDLCICTVAEKRVCHMCRSLNRADLMKVFFPENIN